MYNLNRKCHLNAFVSHKLNNHTFKKKTEVLSTIILLKKTEVLSKFHMQKI